MFVAGVFKTDSGPAVFLKDAKEETVLPIWIGEAEARAIQLRHERRRFARPLTHDLIDTFLKELGGEIVRIHVDDLKGSTFVGTIFLKKNGKIIEIDARPSDSIAIALGQRAPIFVAVKVIRRAGVERDKVQSGQTKEL